MHFTRAKCGRPTWRSRRERWKGCSRSATRSGAAEKREPLTPQRREELLSALDALASRGARVLGVAFRGLEEMPPRHGEIESGLTIIGMVALADPHGRRSRPRSKSAAHAGIRPIMITGDYPLTSQYVAAEIGLTGPGATTLTGEQLARLSESDLDAAVRDVSVFARVTPENKLAIVDALKRKRSCRGDDGRRRERWTCVDARRYRRRDGTHGHRRGA